MRFRVLGPLQLWNGHGWSTVPASRQRVLLALLLTEAGRVVTTERLVDELWGAAPPRGAIGTVQVYVGRLRRLLHAGTPGALATRGRGYELLAGDADLDARVFEQLVWSGRQALAAGRPDHAVGYYRDGLRLWHGPAFGDVPATPGVAAEATRLAQRRLAALEESLEARLRIGYPGAVVDELARLVDEQPLRERLRALHMLALYRCGRRAEALQAFRRARQVLVDELGLEPGPELRELQQAILADDPKLVAKMQTAIETAWFSVDQVVLGGPGAPGPVPDRQRPPGPTVAVPSAAPAEVIGCDEDGRPGEAGAPPGEVGGAFGSTSERVRSEIGVLLDALGHIPAFVLGRCNDVLAWNALAWRLFGDPDTVADASRSSLNWARHVLTSRYLRRMLVDWENSARDVVDDLRGLAIQRPYDGTLRALVAELTATSSDFARLWADAGAAGPRRWRRREYDHPTAGRLSLIGEMTLLPDDAGQRLVVLAPVPGTGSAERLTELAAHCGEAAPKRVIAA